MTWTKIPYKAPLSGDVIDKINQERKIINWCQENFPHGEWLIYPNKAEFKHKQDAIMFALKWL